MFKLFTVFDRESKTYDRPFAAPTERDAKAGFANAVNNKETMFGQHPQDFELHYMGEFDPRTGRLYNVQEESDGFTPKLICTANSLLKGEQ